MAKTTVIKSKTKPADKYRTHKQDTGSTGIQIVLLSERIKELTGHLKKHKQDHDSRVGLLKMVGKRRRLLDYLSNKDKKQYESLTTDLKLKK